MFKLGKLKYIRSIVIKITTSMQKIHIKNVTLALFYLTVNNLDL